MADVEEQLRDYWSAITASSPVPTAAEVMDPVGPQPDATGAGGPGSRAFRGLVLVAAAVVLIAGAVGVYLLFSGGEEDGATVTTDAPPAPDIDESPQVEEPEPATPVPVEENTDEQGQQEPETSSGTAAETWLPGSEGRALVIPWQGGFAAFRALDVPSLGDAVEAEAWLSSDGVEWTPWRNVVLPPFERIRSDGSRVVTVRGLDESELPPGVVESNMISASDDLVDWQTWDLTPGPPIAQREGSEVSVDIGDLQMHDGGWVAASSYASHFDSWSLFPPELQEVFDAGQGGSTSGDDSGLTITPEGGDTVFLSWDELGMDRQTFQQLQRGVNFQRIVTADWDGDLVVHEVDGPGPGRPLVWVTDGALASDGGSGLRFSTDWKTWSDLPEPPWGDQPVRGLVRVEGGVIAVTDTIWFGSPDGSDWTKVEHPRLEGRRIATRGFGSAFAGSSEGFVIVADLADYGDGYSPMMDPRTPRDESAPDPEIVLIASADGQRWLVEDLDVGNEDMEIWRLDPIISGNRILLLEDGEQVAVFEIE